MGLFDDMKVFDNLRGLLRKKKKPDREEIILDTKVDLRQLQQKYALNLEMQRRILNNKDTTQHQREEAEKKIRAGICSYAVVTQALNDLNEISSDIELNQSMGKLGVCLKTINNLGREAGGDPAKVRVNREIRALSRNETKNRPEDYFNAESLDAIDQWIGTAWDEVATKYTQGASLKESMRGSMGLLDSSPFEDSDIIGSTDFSGGRSRNDILNDLMNYNR